MIGKNTRIWHVELSNISPYALIGKDCVIHSHVWIGEYVEIGDRCKVQAFSFIPTGVIIGHDCFIAPRVTFTNDKKPPSGRKKWLVTKVGNGVSIGAGAVILPGLVIGDNAVIGAGAVVTKDVPAGVTVVGNPAKPLTARKVKG
jgi:acetyltransferase-like isoleucine patch superfamily enzyme